MDYRRAIEDYYRAFRDVDRRALESLLTPDFHFISGFNEYLERDTMLDEIWPEVGQTWATDLQIFGDGPEFVVLYEIDHAPEVERPKMRMAEYVRFRGDRVAEIEVFIGRQLTNNSIAD